MSDSELSENEASDVEEYVSMPHKNFTEDNSPAEVESSESTVLSVCTPGQFVSEADDTGPKSNEAADINWFVLCTVHVPSFNCGSWNH